MLLVEWWLSPNTGVLWPAHRYRYISGTRCFVLVGGWGSSTNSSCLAWVSFGASAVASAGQGNEAIYRKGFVDVLNTFFLLAEMSPLQRK